MEVYRFLFCLLSVNQDRNTRLMAIKDLINQLPKVNHDTLKEIIFHLTKYVQAFFCLHRWIMSGEQLRLSNTVINVFLFWFSVSCHMLLPTKQSRFFFFNRAKGKSERTICWLTCSCPCLASVACSPALGFAIFSRS